MNTKNLSKHLVRVFFAEYKPYDFVYKQFIQLKLDQVPFEYFFQHASSILEELRRKTWDKYQELEKSFSSSMLMALYQNINFLNP